MAQRLSLKTLSWTAAVIALAGAGALGMALRQPRSAFLRILLCVPMGSLVGTFLPP